MSDGGGYWLAMLYVVLGGPRGDVELGGDGLVAQSAGHQTGNLIFAPVPPAESRSTEYEAVDQFVGLPA